LEPLQPLAKPPSLHQSVQVALKEYITTADLKPGDALPAESELARQLGVSRNSVREAVKSLEMVGIVETRRGSGVFVGSFSFDPLLEALPYGLMVDTHDLIDLLDVRGALEDSMVPRAIAAQTPEQIVRLRNVLDAMRERAEANERIDREDRAFHRTLFEVVGNLDELAVVEPEPAALRADIHHDLGWPVVKRTERGPVLGTGQLAARLDLELLGVLEKVLGPDNRVVEMLLRAAQLAGIEPYPAALVAFLDYLFVEFLGYEACTAGGAEQVRGFFLSHLAFPSI